jgi:hypothetical protein
MALVETGHLRASYARLADRFKALWTFHHFAAGVHKNFLLGELAYSIDFQRLYADLKSASRQITADQQAGALAVMESSERDLERATRELLLADARIPPPLVRRFFENLKQQDVNIASFLIRFYLTGDAVVGDRRDKLDYLFTRIGEEYVESGGEYRMRDSLELRGQLFALVSVRGVPPGDRIEVVRLIRALRGMRDELQQVAAFEELTRKNLLNNARMLKHRIGDLYFDPDVLLAVIELNVATKNRFLTLYRGEEGRLDADAAKLIEYEEAIRRNFGESNPELVEEIDRFRSFKRRFDESRAVSNVKHDVLTGLKSSMNNILAQLDRGLSAEDDDELPQAFFLQAQQSDAVAERFGDDPLLHPYLVRVASAVSSLGAIPGERMSAYAVVRELGLEAWEVAACQRLYGPAERAVDETEEALLLMVRSSALRVKIDEEARTIAATPLTAPLDRLLLGRASLSLDRAKEFDDQFCELLQEAALHASSRSRHQLYRARFRLLRGFSGLWLIYDQRTGEQ